MSKIKNGGLYQYGAGPFEQQQFGTAGVEGVNRCFEFSKKQYEQAIIPEREYVTFESLLSQIRLSVCLSVCRL